MAIVFAVRGDSLDARYSSNGKTPLSFATSAPNDPVVAASAISGVIGGNIIDLDKGVATTYRYLQYNGRNNTPTKAMSVLLRCTFGTAAGLMGVWNISGGDQATFDRVLIYRNGGTIYALANNERANAILNISAAWTPTVDTIYDIVFTWDGTTTANAAKIYIDGVLAVQGTASGAAPTDSRIYRQYISLGSSAYDVQQTRMRVNEFVIWDSVIDPTSVSLTSGTGSLNGASRNAFVDVSLFDGQSYSNPGIGNVLSGTNYIYAGSTLTGTLGASSDPGVANVLSGTSYLINGSTLTGTLHVGTYSNPGIANVANGTSYIFNDSTLTGTLTVPVPATGSTSTVDLNNIKEQIRYILTQANTTTASPVDLSSGISDRVQKILKIHPEMIPIQASFYPCVTCYITNKEIKREDISRNQLTARRRATVNVNIVGAIWNDTFARDTEDPADEDINRLMENIELTLRAYANLGNNITWQVPNNVEYYVAPLDEQTHLRAGLISVNCEVFY